jgi:hypothetical protein
VVGGLRRVELVDGPELPEAAEPLLATVAFVTALAA